uniref:Putative secreted protein n=1 Tax=Ixodes ricinus TaxID=34613 RepID=A0A0K8R3R0_IXORI
MKSFTLCLFLGVLLIVAWSSISSGAPVHNGPPQQRLDDADSNQLESLRTLEIQTEQKEDTDKIGTTRAPEGKESKQASPIRSRYEESSEETESEESDSEEASNEDSQESESEEESEESESEESEASESEEDSEESESEEESEESEESESEEESEEREESESEEESEGE